MKKSIFAAILCAGALMAAGPAAHAGDVDVGISIGVPGVIWGGPAYYPPPPPRYYHPRPRVVVVPERVYVPGPGYRQGWHDRGHYDHHWKGRGPHGVPPGHRGRGWRD